MKRGKIYYGIAILVFVTVVDTYTQDLVWTREAESGILEGNADINQACANASNGEFVRLYTDVANGLSFHDVSVPETGTYRLVIDYYYDGSQPLEVFANEVSIGVYTFPTSIWCYQGNASTMEIGIDLLAGKNTLKFKPANGLNAPFLDKFDLFTIAPPEVEFFAASTRVLPGTEIQLLLEASDILAESKWVELTVSGIATEDYLLADETLTIPAGTMSASTSLSLLNQEAAHGTEFMVAIQSTETGLEIGESSAVSIRIINQPEVMYVSSSEGSDLNSGTDPEEPYETLEKVSSLLLLPGDSLLFKSADVFTGQLKINGSGDETAQLYIGNYEEGDPPLINGAIDEKGSYASAILIENQDHITIQGLAVANDRNTSRAGESDEDAYGIQVLNSGDKVMKNFHFTDLTIKNIYAITTEGVDFNQLQTAAIQFRTLKSDDQNILRNISDVLVENCYITHTTKAGIWSRHNGAPWGAGNDSINRNMNLVFRNNHFFETGGSGIILSKSYNCLLENNIFEYTGSDYDSRMAKRGSGAWFWSCRNIIAQYNRSLHVRGPADSYGMHIDFGNENVFLQYNYSEDSEGGFVEILGDNINSVYRFNVSVNDGFRNNKGNSLWISDYAGSGTPGIKSNLNYIYNNTIYVDAEITPDISLTGVDTYIYNNIFYATGSAEIGQNVDLNTATSGSLNVSNNLYFGNITNQFKLLDNSPVEGDPMFSDPGKLNSDGYTLQEGSTAMNAGLSFTEPIFPQAGKGIFEHITSEAKTDHFGNAVSISSSNPHIGAYAGSPVSLTEMDLTDFTFSGYYDSKHNVLKIKWQANFSGSSILKVADVTGKVLFSDKVPVIPGENRVDIPINSSGFQGILLVILNTGTSFNALKIPIQ